MIWSVDAELDEILSDTKVAMNAAVDTSSQSAIATAQMSKAKKAKQNADVDKERLQLIVKKLLVNIPFFFLNVQSSFSKGIWYT